MIGHSYSKEVLGETSPLRSSTEENKSLPRNFNSFYTSPGEDVEIWEQISTATCVGRTWEKWGNVKKTAIVILSLAILGIAVILVISVTSSSSTSSNLKKNSLYLPSYANVLKSSGPRRHSDSNLAEKLRRSHKESVVEIPQGKLRWGAQLVSRDGRDYYAFYKVPYAKPPVGDLRFEMAQPPEKWDGVRGDSEVAPQCIQREKYPDPPGAVYARGEEDCLYMNIYTPKLPGIELSTGAPLMPTLFYIHGGGFTDGNGSRYGGKYFMDKDAVLVTFQYRLGVFGFLSSEDGTIKGNLALKDQMQCLRWVKDNIHHFGGSPDSIMIYGNSAGAQSVNLIMPSPMAAGLFNTAITQSGPNFGALVKPKEVQLKTLKTIATLTNCWTDNESEKRLYQDILQCLRQKNASELATLRHPDIVYAPTLETYDTEDESEKFLPDTVYNLYKGGNVNQVPWVLGVNSREWIHAAVGDLKDLELVDNLNNNWVDTINTLYMNPYDDSPAEDIISAKSKEFYFGENKIGNDTLFNLESIISDRQIVHGSKTQGMWMAELGVPVFLYMMSKRPAKSYSDGALAGYPPRNYGASHADELQYLFNYSGFPEYLNGSEYYEFSKKLVDIWVQFAATGDPGWSPIVPNQQPVSWYELNDQMGPTRMFEERMKFWDQFTPEELCYDRG